jgi:hypothetical protein
MNLPKYDILPDETNHIYEFISKGKNGKIYKMVKFQETNLTDVYNLGFGDKDPLTEEIDDMVVSDNGDMEKVLATVISIIYVFTEKFPDKWVFIQGSSPVRTRLYRIIITKYLNLIKKDFFLKCWLNGEWEDFLPNVIYQGFAIKRKNN